MDKADAAKLAALVSAENRLVRWSFAHEEPEDAQWEIDSTTIYEPLSCAYEARVDLTSDDGEASTLLGVNAVLTYDRVGHTHQVCGIISELRYGPSAVENEPRRVSLSVVPAFELLRHQTNCRVFQGMTVPDIVTSVLDEGLGAYGREHDAADLAREYPVREYTVQHQESDFDFVSRLLESEGIGYRFKHPLSEDDSSDELAKEVMVLFDETVSLEPSVAQDDEPLPIVSRPTDLGEVEAIFALNIARNTTTTRVTMRQYDWTRPQLALDGDAEFTAQDGVQRQRYVPEKTQTFDYSGLAYAGDDVREQTSLRLEAAMLPSQQFTGKSIVTGMRPGLAFETEDDSVMPGKFLVTTVTHSNSGAAGAEAGQSYHNTFTCIALAQPYRPKRKTPKPVINSIQTALVVGEAVPDASQQKIFVDAHGRVKVQFQWDRVGEKTEKNRCFLRCITPWAGAGFGVAFIPRVGMEVAVSFINGNPDAPVITGCLYNADNPFPLTAAEATQSLIRTHSETGSGFNEMRFEDKDGSECISVHAERDYNEVVKRSHSTSVGGSQSNSVGGDQSISVTGDQKVTVTGNRTKTVTGNETTTVSKDRTKTVTGNETTTVDKNRTETVGADETITLTKGSRTVTLTSGVHTLDVTGEDSIDIKGSRLCHVTGDHGLVGDTTLILTQGATNMTFASDAVDLTAGASITATHGSGSLQIADDGSIAIKSGATITVEVGSSSIVIDSSGVTIKGSAVTVEATGKAVIKGTAGVDIN